MLFGFIEAGFDHLAEIIRAIGALVGNRMLLHAGLAGEEFQPRQGLNLAVQRQRHPGQRQQQDQTDFQNPHGFIDV